MKCKKFIYLHKKANISCLTQQTFVLMKMSLRRLADIFVFVFRRRLQDVLVKTNMFVLAIRLQDVWQKGLQNVWKTSSRHLPDIFKMYHQFQLFLLKRLREVFNAFLRPTPKTVIYRGICLGHTTSEKFMVSV